MDRLLFLLEIWAQFSYHMIFGQQEKIKSININMIYLFFSSTVDFLTNSEIKT